MNIGARILFGYVLVLGLVGYFLVYSALEELKPGMRQSAEETLVDTANLLAEIVAEDVKRGTLAQSDFAVRLRDYAARKLNAEIWGVTKVEPNHRVYVTDAQGIVIFDSQGRDLGADYSQWNDVYRTLRGSYGARSTAEDPADEESTVMYVAAPIRDGERIIGVLTVGKPNLSMQPFLDRIERHVVTVGAIALLGALALAGLMSWWTSRSVRARLEGQAYVEQYVQTLTHELKSPIASILGAAELLGDDVPAAERARFVGNISDEARRMQQLIERLLDLAVIEQRRGLDERAHMDVSGLIDELIGQRSTRIHARQLVVSNRIPRNVGVVGERFLVQQAFGNLFDNAIAFTPDAGTITFEAERTAAQWIISCQNSGAHIPDYALPRLTERFFSLPQPDTGRKSSGLGLSIAAQVAELHGGTLRLANDPAGGVVASMSLPAH